MPNRSQPVQLLLRSHRNSRTLPQRTAWLLALGVALLFGAACGAPEESAPPAPEPTVNADLNVSFEQLPSGFEVDQSTADSIWLKLAEDDGSKRAMWLEVDERSDFGIQLTNIVASQKEQFEAIEGGSFSGNRKLNTQAGEAYYSRGGYPFEGAEVEETRIFMVHPTENRLVTFHYRYPATDDSAQRINELFAWVGELQAAQPAGTTPEESSS